MLYQGGAEDDDGWRHGLHGVLVEAGHGGEDAAHQQAHTPHRGDAVVTADLAECLAPVSTS